ncbi:MAG: YgaP family membrane protein [Candidatus Thorarchaeota archaeon]
MYLENARALVQGSMVLAFAAMAVWVHFEIGIILVAMMGFLLIQSSFTNWCIPDPFLRRLGFRKRLE